MALDKQHLFWKQNNWESLQHFKYLMLQTLDIANTRRCNHSIRALMVGTTANSESSCCCVWEWAKRNLPPDYHQSRALCRLIKSSAHFSTSSESVNECVWWMCLSPDYSHTLLLMIMKSGINVFGSKAERIFYFPRVWKWRWICESLSQMGVEWGLQFTELLVIILYLNWLHNESEI